MKNKTWKHGIIIFFSLLPCFVVSLLPYQAVKCQAPIQVGTETEDIALTDDLNIAKAQVEKYPDNVEAHFNLAIALSRTSLVEEAIKELRRTKLLTRKEQNAGIIDKKINEYKEILKNSPDLLTVNNVRYRLAFSHYLKAYLINKEIEKKDAKKSSLLGSKALMLSNKNPEIKHNLELSLLYFKELLTINPNDPWAKVYYAFILAEQFNEINKARELWNEVVKLDPNNPAPHFFLGELHIKEGNLKEGILEISQAILLRSIFFNGLE